MQETQAVNEIAQTIEQTISAGMAGIAAVLALTLLIIALAGFFFIRGINKNKDAGNQNQKAIIDALVSQTQQHVATMSSVIDNNTEALNKNSDTRTQHAVAITEQTHATNTQAEKIGALILEVKSSTGLIDSTVSTLALKVQNLIGEVSAMSVKVDRMVQLVTEMGKDDQTAALVRGVAAELQQISDLIISTLRPPKNAIEPKPETSE